MNSLISEETEKEPEFLTSVKNLSFEVSMNIKLFEELYKYTNAISPILEIPNPIDEEPEGLSALERIKFHTYRLKQSNNRLFLLSVHLTDLMGDI